ncbi:MAG: hypothetical protein HC898_02995 [Phycisphaerales bacterium]|nr:hypothetical protein [Phycisphaerales bacterium]
MPPSTVQVVEAAGASGGKAVTSGKEWEPIFALPLPAEGQRFEIHFRHLGGPIQLKSVIDGKQKEHNWIWDQPEQWKWSSFGTYTREQLGTSIVLIRGGKTTIEPVLDCVVLTQKENIPTGTAPLNVPDPIVEKTHRHAQLRLGQVSPSSIRAPEG